MLTHGHLTHSVKPSITSHLKPSPCEPEHVRFKRVIVLGGSHCQVSQTKRDLCNPDFQNEAPVLCIYPPCQVMIFSSTLGCSRLVAGPLNRRSRLAGHWFLRPAHGHPQVSGTCGNLCHSPILVKAPQTPPPPQEQTGWGIIVLQAHTTAR